VAKASAVRRQFLYWKMCCGLKTWKGCADKTCGKEIVESRTGQALPNLDRQGVPSCRVYGAPETDHPVSSVPDASAPTREPSSADRAIRLGLPGRGERSGR
jgi:hypothetical protein